MLGLVAGCGGTSTATQRPSDHTGDAAKNSLGWCTGAVSLASGSQGDGACIVKADGSLWCWGNGGCDELGVPGLVFSAVPVAIPRDGLGSGATSVSVGWASTCAVERTGSVACWGNTMPWGSPCSGTPLPTPVSGLPSGISAVATGSGVVITPPH